MTTLDPFQSLFRTAHRMADQIPPFLGTVRRMAERAEETQRGVEALFNTYREAVSLNVARQQAVSRDVARRQATDREAVDRLTAENSLLKATLAFERLLNDRQVSLFNECSPVSKVAFRVNERGDRALSYPVADSKGSVRGVDRSERGLSAPLPLQGGSFSFDYAPTPEEKIRAFITDIGMYSADCGKLLSTVDSARRDQWLRRVEGYLLAMAKRPVVETSPLSEEAVRHWTTVGGLSLEAGYLLRNYPLSEECLKVYLSLRRASPEYDLEDRQLNKMRALCVEPSVLTTLVAHLLEKTYPSLVRAVEQVTLRVDERIRELPYSAAERLLSGRKGVVEYCLSSGGLQAVQREIGFIEQLSSLLGFSSDWLEPLKACTEINTTDWRLPILQEVPSVSPSGYLNGAPSLLLKI